MTTPVTTKPRSRRLARAARVEARRAALSAPGPRGLTGPAGGSASGVKAPKEWIGSTMQVCGLWPWAAGAGVPSIGATLGRHQDTGQTVCADPISWYRRARLISQPSMFLLGLPALGKSTLVRRMAICLSAMGVPPLVLGDLKGEYVEVTRALDGQVVRVGPGVGYLNVLDVSEAHTAAARIEGSAAPGLAVALRESAATRRLDVLEALISVVRGQPPTNRETDILDAALEHLDRTGNRAPVMADLLGVVKEAPASVRDAALDRGEEARYRDITEELEATLGGMARGGKLRRVFSEPTSEPMRRDRAVCFDISSINIAHKALSAAGLLACWSYGFGVIEAQQYLADAGLEDDRAWLVVLDELWRALRAAVGLVDSVDALTRLNRHDGVGQVMISHTMSDLKALPNPEDRAKAAGFVERAGVVMMGGLPWAEMPMLQDAIRLSEAEQQRVTSWRDLASWDADGSAPPPGRGKFLIKVGGKPGIPFDLVLTRAERGLNDTDKRWHDRLAAGSAAPPKTGEDTDVFREMG